MALANKKKLIREIAMMVRKEFIQFEPADRVIIPSFSSKTKTGDNVFYVVGGVGYNSYSGDIQYNMFNDRGQFIVPTSTPRSLENLPYEVLSQVQEKVATYCDRAMLRASNLALLSNAIDNSIDNKVYFFVDDGIPQGFIDPKRNGDLVHVSFLTLFRGSDGNLYVSGLHYIDDEGAEEFNYPVNDLTDMSVAEIASCIPSRLKEMIQIDEKKKDFDLHLETLLDAAENAQVVVYFASDLQSSRSTSVLDAMHSIGIHYITIDLTPHDILKSIENDSWSLAEHVANIVFEDLEYDGTGVSMLDFGRMDFLFTGDSEYNVLDQMVLDQFMSKVISSIDFKSDFSIRRVVSDGSDGIALSSVTGAAGIGKEIIGGPEFLKSGNFGLEHLSHIKDVYLSILSSPKPVAEYNKLLSSQQKQKGNLNIKM